MKKISIVLLLALMFNDKSFTQDLDSLFYSFLYMKGKTALIDNSFLQNYSIVEKCGLGIIIQVQNNLERFSPEQQSILEVLLTRPELQKSFVTPGGFFRVHYDSSGLNAPGYDLNDFAQALDSAYNFEVNILGYIAPPVDNGLGGDDLFDIYIVNLGNGYYGATTPEVSIGNNRSISYIEIDNDFIGSGFNSTGIAGAQVTAAHEFHHAIQVGSYINRYSLDDFYYEISSTAMEEFVFDDVNDYYAYMNSYFTHPERTFSANDGYNLAAWNIFLKDRYDFNVLRRIWELMVDNRALVAINLALAEKGSSFKHELNNFGVWTYFTNSKAVSGEYFEEAVNYPSIIPISNYNFQPPRKEVMIGSKPVSNNFLVFIDLSQGASDTMVSIITNGDVNSGLIEPPPTFDFTYVLANQPEQGAVKIIHNYYSKITSANNSFLQEVNIFNNVAANPNLEREIIDFVYPQPFSYEKNAVLNIPTVLNPANEAELYIYTPAMDLVYSGTHTIFSISKIIVQWDGKDNNGKKLPSGIYVYITKSGDNIKKGKFVIYND